MECVVKFDTLSTTFVPRIFEARDWANLFGNFEDPIDELVKEFYSNARTIFLMELKEKTFIDISSHIFDPIVDETKTTSRPMLIFPSLLMRLFRAKGVEIPQDISPMPTPSAINKLTIIRIKVRLPGDEEVGDQGEGDQMETKIVTAGKNSTPRS